MDWQEMTTLLERPEAFPSAPASVELRHTHISVVFLAGDFVYKLKKPVNLGFLDFTDPEDRRRFCHEEVRLNRRLAPGVYLGVVPVTMTPEGPVFEGDGPAIEWAVKMRRLPDSATLGERLARGLVDEAVMKELGGRIAEFHRSAAAGDDIAAHGRFEVVARNSRENFEQARAQVGHTLSSEVWSRLCEANERRLDELRGLIGRRATASMTRDTHGDLHLDHVYHFPGEAPPANIIILDCVEFNEAYRCGDVVSDMAFICMDLLYRGRRDLMETFAESYFGASGDREGRELLEFYIAYRAAVRGKVDGMKATEAEVPRAARDEASSSSRAHWLLALGMLEEPADRPALVLTCGLPGSGKSRLAADLEQKAGFVRIASDVVRKELAGLKPTESGKAAFGEGIYTGEWNRRTYAECLGRAADQLFLGKRVVVDASFREEGNRKAFLDLARSMGVEALIFERVAPEEVVRERLGRRSEGSVSDADWEVSRRAAMLWEPPGENTVRRLVTIPHLDDKHKPLVLALEALSAMGLY